MSQEKKAGADRVVEVSEVLCDSASWSTYRVGAPGLIPALLELTISWRVKTETDLKLNGMCQVR